MTFYTIGHSTRKIGEFISLLKLIPIILLADVRAFPVSRRNPQFNKENLQAALQGNRIEYIWLGWELGGYRGKEEGLGKESPNKGWTREGFCIYADYMFSEKFKTGAARLVDLAREKRLAYLCAEKYYWRCHRRLISDYLVSQGHEVWHIVDPNKILKHELSPWAKIKEGKLTYPPLNSTSGY